MHFKKLVWLTKYEVKYPKQSRARFKEVKKIEL